MPLLDFVQHPLVPRQPGQEQGCVPSLGQLCLPPPVFANLGAATLAARNSSGVVLAEEEGDVVPAEAE